MEIIKLENRMVISSNEKPSPKGVDIGEILARFEREDKIRNAIRTTFYGAIFAITLYLATAYIPSFEDTNNSITPYSQETTRGYFTK